MRPHHPASPGPPFAILARTRRGAVERGAKRIRVHVLTDGRDVPDGSSVTFVQQLEEDLKALSDK